MGLIDQQLSTAYLILQPYPIFEIGMFKNHLMLNFEILSHAGIFGQGGH